MARSKQAEPKWKDYPLTDKSRTGCKVSWNYYESDDAAKRCAEAARWNASIQEAQGYDFGYCAPGWIEKMTHPAPHGRPELAGLYEVCIP